MGDQLNEPPGLPGLQVEVTGFIQANQDSIGQIADSVGRGHARPGCQPASSRSV